MCENVTDELVCGQFDLRLSNVYIKCETIDVCCLFPVETWHKLLRIKLDRLEDISRVFSVGYMQVCVYFALRSLAVLHLEGVFDSK